jgi:mRNA interferase MazF
MNRGDIYFVSLDPTIGSEIRKTRPVVIISNNASNNNSSLITVIPLTSNTKRVFPFEVLLKKRESGLPKDSKAQCNQIRSLSIKRIIGKKVSKLDSSLMHDLEEALRLHLNI